jgi:hypothetical protein
MTVSTLMIRWRAFVLLASLIRSLNAPLYVRYFGSRATFEVGADTLGKLVDQ